MRWDAAGLTSYGVDDGLAPGKVRSFVETRAGDLVAIGDGHLWERLLGRRFAGASPRWPAKTAAGWGWNQIAFEDERGAWWIAATGGVAVFSAVASPQALAGRAVERLYTAADGLPGFDVFRLYRDRAGRVWASLVDTGGLAVLRPGSRRFASVESGGAVSRTASGADRALALAFAENAAGEVWIAFDDGRLGRWRDDHFTVLDLPAEASAIVALRFDSRGRLWFATQGGAVARLSLEAQGPPRVERFRLVDAGAPSEILSLELDAFDRPYFGSWAGVDRLDPERRQVRHFDRRDGLVNNVVSTIHRDRSGALWFGTFQGASRMMPEPQAASPRVPGLRLTGLDVAGARYALPEFGVERLDALRLAAEQNNLRVRLAGLASAEPCELSTRLADAEPAFSGFSPDAVVTYAGLRPGAYRLEARVRCANDEAPGRTVLSFTILAPWWQRGWFVAAVVVAAAALAFAYHRQRLQRLVAVERVRTQIATDLHDDLGQDLSRIAILSEVVKRSPIVDARYLDEIADTARAPPMPPANRQSDRPASTFAEPAGAPAPFLGGALAERGIAWRLTFR